MKMKFETNSKRGNLKVLFENVGSISEAVVFFGIRLVVDWLCLGAVLSVELNAGHEPELFGSPDSFQALANRVAKVHE